MNERIWQPYYLNLKLTIVGLPSSSKRSPTMLSIFSENIALGPIANVLRAGAAALPVTLRIDTSAGLENPNACTSLQPSTPTAKSSAHCRTERSMEGEVKPSPPGPGTWNRIILSSQQRPPNLVPNTFRLPLAVRNRRRRSGGGADSTRRRRSRAAGARAGHGGTEIT
jgi:hypothetical protein